MCVAIFLRISLLVERYFSTFRKHGWIIKYLPVIFAAILPYPASGRADTYYVSALNGNDANNGLSTARPFRTIGNAVRTMRAGDTTVVLQGSYSECIEIKPTTGARSGTASARITLKAQNPNNVVITNQTPCFIGINTKGNTIRYIMDIRDISHWVIEGFNFSYKSGFGGPGSVYMLGASNIAVRGNKFQGNDRVSPNHIIRLDGENSFITIKGNLIERFPNRLDTYGVFLGDLTHLPGDGTPAPNDDIRIINNTFRGLGGDGIQTGNGGDTDILIEGNKFERIYNEPGCDALPYCEENAIDIKRSHRVTIRNNTMQGYRPKPINGGAGESILIHNGADDVTIEGNTIYNCNMGIVVEKGPLASKITDFQRIERITIKYNVIFNMDKHGRRFEAGSGIVIRHAQGVKVAHNVIAHTQGMGLSVGREFFDNDTLTTTDDTMVNQVEVRNNIFYKNTERILNIAGNAGNKSYVTVGVNYFNPDGTTKFRWQNSRGTTITGNLQKLLGLTPQADGSISDNPLFVDPDEIINVEGLNAGVDSLGIYYWLRSASRARNRGEAVLGFDGKRLNTVPDRMPDLGTFEFGQ